MKRTVTIIDPSGLHARPVSLLVQIANRSASDCFLHFEDKQATLKSILFVMSLGVPNGATITLEVIGDDGDTVLEEMLEVLREHRVIEAS
jgi:phosphocarrier protein